MAGWTFNEPWPNSAHGCIVDFYGLPKMAYYWVKQSMQMVDISLSYSDLWQQAGKPLQAHIWVDNEMEDGLTFSYSIEYFTPDGDIDLSEYTENGVNKAFVDASDHTMLGQPCFVPPKSLVGKVLVARISAFSLSRKLLATNDYHFAIVDTVAAIAQKTYVSGPLHPLLTVPKVDISIVGQDTTFSVTVRSSTVSALYAKPVLLNKRGTQLPYVVFKEAYVTIRPNTLMNFTIVEQGTKFDTASQFCVEAWNTDRTCIDYA